MASTARRGSELARFELYFLCRRHPPTHRPHRMLAGLTSHPRSNREPVGLASHSPPNRELAGLASHPRPNRELAGNGEPLTVESRTRRPRESPTTQLRARQPRVTHGRRICLESVQSVLRQTYATHGSRRSQPWQPSARQSLPPPWTTASHSGTNTLLCLKTSELLYHR
ncbi:hypothetical protein TIFTF001_030789 [Ficus carica]|uniref:Uncharacterized protein n=1 Tax=Ficus carica TaxID=3494 RepID=A0AA88J5G2_FICCA|nr:hypothetical protein TIFTF001_030789 [Ficus carica]